MAADELTRMCWEIAERLGKPRSEHMKAYEAVTDELTAEGLPRSVAMDIGAYVSNWKQTKNPFYLDKAFLVLAAYNGKPTETMLAEDCAAREARYNGALAGTSDAIKSEEAERDALYFMANLIFLGMASGKASRKAAHYYSLRYPNLKRKKASTLERYYAQKIKNSGFENELFSTWERIPPKPEWEQALSDIFRNFPDCSADLVGNARD